MQVVWTDPALERVDEIAVYIARDDPDAAARWTIELFDAVERLTQFPKRGRPVPEFGLSDQTSTCTQTARRGR
jgi:toxin ParE1/3/4